jgi:hypothetical protein
LFTTAGELNVETMISAESLIALAVGLGLAAAAGMRVFLPLFVLGVSGASGIVPLADGWSWVASPAALIGLGTAMALEIGAYYIPWLDNALDVLATPAALIAGMMATASVLIDVPPMLKWAIVIIGGGGMAGLTQGASVLARAKSSALTGGLANPAVSTVEWMGALLIALLAVLLPIAALLLVLTLIVFVVRRTGRLLFGKQARAGKPVAVSSDTPSH